MIMFAFHQASFFLTQIITDIFEHYGNFLLKKFSAGRPLVGKNCEWEASVKCRADRSIFVSIPEAAVQQYANGMQNALVQGSLKYFSHINSHAVGLSVAGPYKNLSLKSIL